MQGRQGLIHIISQSPKQSLKGGMASRGQHNKTGTKAHNSVTSEVEDPARPASLASKLRKMVDADGML